jgi:microcystin-dependent protein
MTGTVLDFAGASAPDGWLMCYGQAISRTDYKNLFDKIGTAYGEGNGSTTFNVPDLRGRVIAGKDDMGGTAANRLTTAGSGVNGAALGASGGAQTHTLDVTQIPAHAHPQTAIPSGSAGASGSPVMSNSSGGSSASGSTSNTGGGLAHNNTQPTMILNKIICY